VVQFDFYYATKSRKTRKSCIHIRETCLPVSGGQSLWRRHAGWSVPPWQKIFQNGPLLDIAILTDGE
jgi:hypothetical protein